MVQFFSMFFSWIVLIYNATLGSITWDFNGVSVSLGSFLIVLSIVAFITGLFFRRS